MIKAAKLDSPRLAPVLALLRARGPAGATSAELAKANAGVAPHTDVAELRANGITVACQYEGRTKQGRKIYRYTITNQTEAR